MSWDSYIDNLIAQSKDDIGKAHVDEACIIGLDGGASWTTSSHPNALKLSEQEGVNIAKCFKSKDFTPFTDGVHINGTHYLFLRLVDDKFVFAKHKGVGALFMQASKKAIVIARCPGGNEQGNANKAVRVIAEYLESLNM